MPAKLFHPVLPALAAGLVLLAGCRNAAVIQPVPQTADSLTLADFSPATSCKECHPQQYDEWSGSMHRYSAGDPIWMLANNSLQNSTSGRLQSWCFQCHAPVGFVTGNTRPVFALEELNPLVREGITCDFCHVMRPPYSTTNQHVQYNVAPRAGKLGGLSMPSPTDHANDSSAAFSRSDVCRPCHDLIVNDVPVEITNREWQDSPWGAMSFECQTCHMPAYTGQAAVGGPVRENLHRHEFIGVDVAITDFPNKARQSAAVDSLLKHAASMAVTVPPHASAGDSIVVAVKVTNDKTGHNLPTSVFFNRQMWIEVTAWSGTDTAYTSGHLDGNGDLMDKNSALRPNEDRDLTLFNGTLYRQGSETNVFELDSLVNRSIPPFASRTSLYGFRVAHAGVWNVRVRLLFRPFGPYLFRSLGASAYVTELPVFEMLASESAVAVH